MRQRSRTMLAVVGVLVGAVAACGGCADDPDPTSDPTPTPSSSAPTSPASPTATEPSDPLATSIAERGACGALLPEGGYEETALRSDDGDVLRAVTFPTRPARARSAVALVLLHQTDAVALCGWGPFAGLAAQRGVPSIAFDLCGYGDSVCSQELEDDPAAQVDLAVAQARRVFSARRVVVVGASMGGAQAVVAVADGADVDAWVDVSAPDGWFVDRPLSTAVASRLPDDVPGLVVFSRSDGDDGFRAARTLAERAGAGFVGAPPGHGWKLLTDFTDALTPVGRKVLAFANG